jgi:hypothetical protein
LNYTRPQKALRHYLIMLAAFSLIFTAVTSICYAETNKLQVPQVETPPAIDGSLDDLCWQTAAKGDNFTLRGLNRPSTEQTEFYVCQDKTALYFGFHCIDSQPDKIRGAITERDSYLGTDDSIVIVLDTFNEHINVDEFWVNALGTQYDERALGTAEKIEWKGDWHAASKMVNDGWTCEVAIPFPILKYKDDCNSMGLNIVRVQKRLGEVSDWSVLDDGGQLDKYGDIEGLVLPKSEKNPVQIMPYLLYTLREDNQKGKIGFDLKHIFGDDDTVLFTVNPDFGYVESAVKSIDFTYTSQRYSDNRPFFQEASSFYMSSYFDTYLIPDFDAGLKVFGKEGKVDYGVMSCLGKKDRMDSVIGARYNFSPKARTKILLISRDDDEVNNKVAEFRVNGNVSDDLYLWMSDAQSFTSGQKDGYDFKTGFWYEDTPWHCSGTFNKGSFNFTPSLGYNDYPGATVWDTGLGYWRDCPGKNIRGYGFESYLSRLWDDEHGTIDQSLYIETTADYANDFSWQIHYSGGPHIANYDFDPSTPSEWYHDYSLTTVLSFDQNDPYRRKSINYTWGKTAGGPSKSLRIRYGLHPLKKLSADLTYKKVDRDNEVEGEVDTWQGVVSAKYEITPEKSISARFVRQDTGNNLTVSYRQQVRKGLDIYALFGDYSAEKTINAFSIKMVMTL